MGKFPIIFERFMDSVKSTFSGRSAYQRKNNIKRDIQQSGNSKSRNLRKIRRKMAKLSRKINRRNSR